MTARYLKQKNKTKPRIDLNSSEQHDRTELWAWHQEAQSSLVAEELAFAAD